MADPTEIPQMRQRPQVSEAMRKEYFDLLVKMVQQHGTTSEVVNARLRAVAADPKMAISSDLIDIIRELCDCKAIIVILECLCKWLTE